MCSGGGVVFEKASRCLEVLQLQRGSCYDHLRCFIEGPKWGSILLVLAVYIIATRNVFFEVVMDHAGVVLNLQLTHSGNSKQQVLIIDVRLGMVTQRVIVIPFGPIQAI